MSLRKRGKAGRKEAERRFGKPETKPEKPIKLAESGSRRGAAGAAEAARRFGLGDDDQ